MTITPSNMEKDEQRLTRRKFLMNTTLVAVSISVPDFMSCKGKETNILPGNSKDCITTADILGPFYKAGAPIREDIIPMNNTGAPLIIEGKVFTGCTTSVVRDAVVEIWNADDKGDYDTSDEFRFRGRYRTTADGTYRFRTIIPGRYLNGGAFRPSHIHFRVTAEGHQELVSQIYFKDDPFIENDPWAGSSAAKERILTIGHDANGTDTVNFTIYLTPDK
jgi:protocatechuate 3,4-dioxygenase beta subunit